MTDIGTSQSLERPCLVRLGELIVAAIQGAAAFARRAHARHRQRRRAMAAYEMLRRLDDRTLRDIGYDRSEILSIAADLPGKAARKSINEVQYEQR